MIQMFVDNKLLVLPTDLKIRIEINSPAFEKDSLPASVIYHFDLPVTPNEEIFNYANYIEVCNKFREYPWKLRYDGFWLFTGKLIITGINNTFRCAATIKQLPTDFSDKDLTDFTWQQIDTPNLQSYINTIRNGNGSPILAFPQIYAPKLYGDANTSFGGIVNHKDSIVNTGSNSNTVIPLFKAMHILDTVFSEQNHKVDYSNLDESIQNLLLFNNRTLDAQPPDYYTYSHLGTNLLQNLLVPTEDKYNCIDTLGNYHVKHPGTYSILANIAGLLQREPTAMFVRVILKLIKFTGAGTESIELYNKHIYASDTIVEEFFDLSVLKDFDSTVKKFTFMLTLDDYPYKITRGNIEISRIGPIGDTIDENTYQTEIKPEQHIPKLSVNDYLLSLKQPFGIAYFIDNINPRLQLYQLQDLLHAKYLDLTPIFIENSMTITVSEPTTFELKYAGDSIDIDIYDFRKPLEAYNSFNDAPAPYKQKQLIKIRQTNSYYTSHLIANELIWQRLGDCFQPKKTASHIKKETIEMKIQPISMEKNNNTVYPYYEDQGISNMFTPDTSLIDKIMYIFQTTEYGASNSGISSNGDELGISMDMDANNGIYNLFTKEWYEFQSSANEYTCTLKMNVEKMLEILNLFKPQAAKTTNQIRQVRIKNQNYIPQQFTFELTHTGINCQAKLMKNDRKR